jgi:ssRNA-specific RNase YbeY (16S rRNA maturation enzyme)
MKIILDINKRAANPISGEFLEKVVRRTIKESGLSFLNQKEIGISLAFLAGRVIKKINKRYRKKNSSTDILSFSNYRDRRALKREKKKIVHLGELLADYEYIKKSAKVNRAGLCDFPWDFASFGNEARPKNVCASG